jgi:hypothetical protein
VYDVTFHQGKVYAASYAGGDITEYDPAKPWDQWGLKNPRPVTTVGPAFVRPIGGIVIGPDGKLYSGWMAQYGKYGGAIAITDPVTGKTERIENPLAEQAIAGIAVDRDYLYFGTSLAANGLPEKQGESPSFGMLDLKTRQVIYSHIFPGASQIRSLVHDRQTHRIAFARDSALTVFDPATRTLTTMPEALPAIGNSALCGDSKGSLFYGSGKSLIRVALKDNRAVTLAHLPANVTGVAVRKDGTIFVACGADIYRMQKNEK